MKRIHFAAAAALAGAVLGAGVRQAAADELPPGRPNSPGAVFHDPSKYGSDAADGSYSDAELTITNNTNATITYYFRWGTRTYPWSRDLGRWQTVTLPPGFAQTHQRGLDAWGRSVAPHIRFFTLDADGLDVRRDYVLGFSAVHYGMTGTTGSPVSYDFEAPDGSPPDLFAQ